MYTYMDYVQQQFHAATGWSHDNNYAHVTDTVTNLLDFSVPHGFAATISAQSTPSSFSSYTLSHLGLVAGSIAYLYSSADLTTTQSQSVDLQRLVSGYHHVDPFSPRSHEDGAVYHGGKRIDPCPTLLYGKMYLPGMSLEALAVRRINPLSQIMVACVSDNRLKNNGAITATYQRDTGRWATDVLYSSQEALVGARTLYNMNTGRPNRPKGRLSAGMELYYGILSKSPGMSTAIRYTTQSAYTGTPLTLTLMSNPIMGHVSASYALRTSTALSFASRFDFNVYSYLSDLSLGCEVWKKKNDAPGSEYSSVLKAAVTVTNPSLKVLWEGRFHDFLLSGGLGLGTGATPTVGLQIQYSS
uniref:Mitochondrial distribution and morphology protein 10 n=1 Tax=Blastobotrys adeninivorans TaxID=409370 RepID=A0A060SYQ1_BLAAD